jgi:hypothetical protein
LPAFPELEEPPAPAFAARQSARFVDVHPSDATRKMAGPFVGRTRELGEIAHGVERIVSGRGGAHLPIPSGIHEALRDRLGRTHEETHLLLEVIAVIGREATLSTIATVAGVSSSHAQDYLQRAVRAGILLERSADSFQFTHVLLRDELYSTLPTDRRARVHASVVSTLEGVGAIGLPVEAIAHHSLECVSIVGAERMTHAVLRAADQSMSVLAFDDAADLLGRAARVLEGAAECPLLLDMVTSQGLAVLRSGDIPTGKLLCGRAAALARELGDSQRFARAALTHGAEFIPSLVDPELARHEDPMDLREGGSDVRAEGDSESTRDAIEACIGIRQALKRQF